MYGSWNRQILSLKTIIMLVRNIPEMENKKKNKRSRQNYHQKIEIAPAGHTMPFYSHCYWGFLIMVP
jgi:hypothetical protein